MLKKSSSSSSGKFIIDADKNPTSQENKNATRTASAAAADVVVQSENDEEYDEIEYLGQTNQSLKTSSKYSISNDYHMKSYTGDSLSLSKDTNDSFR